MSPNIEHDTHEGLGRPSGTVNKPLLVPSLHVHAMEPSALCDRGGHFRHCDKSAVG